MNESLKEYSRFSTSKANQKHLWHNVEFIKVAMKWK